MEWSRVLWENVPLKWFNVSQTAFVQHVLHIYCLGHQCPILSTKRSGFYSNQSEATLDSTIVLINRLWNYDISYDIYIMIYIWTISDTPGQELHISDLTIYFSKSMWTIYYSVKWQIQTVKLYNFLNKANGARDSRAFISYPLLFPIFDIQK